MSNAQLGSTSKTAASNKPVAISNPPYRSPPASASASNDISQTQRRAGQSINKSTATPRNNQAEKSKHKQSHRYRFADEDALAESANMQSGNSRKGRTSITHLIDFSSPRPTQQQLISRSGYSRNTRRNPTWGLGSGYHAVDKARYVHANYRFIVDPRSNYHAQSVDADVHLDWKVVLQILASPHSQAASCPICLDSPVAPRMAKCGHIFCLPCAIRFMHSDDGERPAALEKKARWKKCPICHDTVYISELRPVRWYSGHDDSVNLSEATDVVLRLIKRSVGSTLAMPRESPNPLAKGNDVPWHSSADVMDHARIIKAGETYMVEQLDNDIAAIACQEREDELMFGEGTDWTSRAVRMLEESKTKVKDIGDPPTARVKLDKPKQEPRLKSISTNEGPGDSSTQPKDGLLSNCLGGPKSPQGDENSPEFYYFYQAFSQFYLSTLDIRILKDAFHEYESFPSSLLPRIERVSGGHVIDDDLRKRAKYLSHLPYGCEVGFLECDWTDTVSPRVLDKYKNEVERRRKRNLEKEAREEKERVAAERASERGFAALSSVDRLTIPPPETLSMEHFQSLSAGALSNDSGLAPSPSNGLHRAQGSAYTLLASPGTSPNTTRTVWGTNAVGLASPEIRPVEGPGLDDGWLQGWEDDLVHPDEQRLVAQVEATSLTDDVATVSPIAKGKKKAKKITLMSTSARRAL